MKIEAEVMVEMLGSVQAQLDRVEQAIEREAEGFEEYGYLKSIPGFGPYVSAMTLAAIGDPHRFENRSQLIRLAGFDLSASRSGEKSRSGGAGDLQERQGGLALCVVPGGAGGFES